jgi:hypothetical protein
MLTLLVPSLSSPPSIYVSFFTVDKTSIIYITLFTWFMRMCSEVQSYVHNFWYLYLPVRNRILSKCIGANWFVYTLVSLILGNILLTKGLKVQHSHTCIDEVTFGKKKKQSLYNRWPLKRDFNSYDNFQWQDNNIVLLRDVFHIGLDIGPRPAVLVYVSPFSTSADDWHLSGLFLAIVETSSGFRSSCYWTNWNRANTENIRIGLVFVVLAQWKFVYGIDRFDNIKANKSRLINNMLS